MKIMDFFHNLGHFLLGMLPLILFFLLGLVDYVLEEPAGQLGRVWEHGGGGASIS